jgi:DHA1 family bicyclomycin/chloramphenicol resistance-like MFS transporter
MSLDMYIPAIPLMKDYFATTDTLVNLTMSGYFLCFSTSILLSGSVSDMLGRRPLLIAGSIVYVIGCVVCALATDIAMLLACRVFQALGAGVMGSAAMATIKDCFAPKARALVFAVGQMVFMLGPVVAPVIGGVILNFFSWRYIFVFLTAFGLVALAFALLFEESLPKEERSGTDVFRTYAGMVHVARIRGFMPLLLVSSLSSASYMSFVALSPYIFVDYYGFSPQGYSYFFAACALITSMGSLVYLKLCKRKVTPRAFTHVLVGMFTAASLLLVPFAGSGAMLFFALCAIIAFCQMTFKAYVNNALLAEVKVEHEAGSASSLITSVSSGIGTMGMLVASLDAGSELLRFVVICVVIAVANLAMWAFYVARDYRLHNMEHVIEEQI